jgi:hypothetical protein
LGQGASALPPPLLELDGQRHGAGADQDHADPPLQRQLLPQEQDPENRHQHDTELVDGRYLRGLPELQRTEIGEPRRPGREAGEHEEQPGLP